MAIDGGSGQEIPRLRMGVQQPFHAEPQRGVAAAGLVQIIRPLRRRLLLERGKKIDSTGDGATMASSSHCVCLQEQCDEFTRTPLHPLPFSQPP